MAENAFTLAVTVRSTRNAVSHGVVYVTGIEAKSKKTKAGGRKALNASNFITGEFSSVCVCVCGRVLACVHLDLSHLIFVVLLNSALDDQQWDH